MIFRCRPKVEADPGGNVVIHGSICWVKLGLTIKRLGTCKYSSRCASADQTAADVYLIKPRTVKW